ncbi:MAG: hypothetical protein Q9160_006806 [Pyrenula sp. 1 TL-2023]
MASEIVQSTVQENNIYLGQWTDWSYGPIAGMTLTLTHRNGGFLIAFVTLFVTITGARFWSTVSFVCHTTLSRRDAQDAIYHQRQAILRNATSSGTSVWRLLRLAWAWRRHDKASLLQRISLPHFLSFITLTSFAVAGIFSSRVATSAGGEVLIASSSCGIFQPQQDVAGATQFGPLNAYTTNRNQVFYADPVGDFERFEHEWMPIPELLVRDGDVNIIFLSANDIRFLNRVEDPWYSATNLLHEYDQYNSSISPHKDFQAFHRDDPARSLGCIERYQFCNPSLPLNIRCTPLGGILQAAQLASQLYQSAAQRDSFSWSSYAITNMAAGIREVVGTLGTSALQSRNSLTLGVQSILPDYQWELEAESWFKLTLADLQRSIVEQATGSTDPFIRQFFIRPNTTDQRRVCANQKIRSGSFTSVNVLGLSIILILGGFIIVMSFVLPSVIELLQRYRHRKAYSILEWLANDALQLQWLAHEATGSGNWHPSSSAYPTTTLGDLLAVLDVTDPKHVKLRNESRGTYGGR